MSTPSQPLKDPSGDHPPGISFHVECKSNDGANVYFLGDHQQVTLSTSKPEDAAYFVVGQKYVVFFAALGG